MADNVTARKNHQWLLVYKNPDHGNGKQHRPRAGDLAVTVFEPGRWDMLAASMKPFSVP